MAKRANKNVHQQAARRKSAALAPKKTISRGTKGKVGVKSGRNAAVRPLRQAGRGKGRFKPTKGPGGRGLGKAGARRLGQLLKRAITEKTNVTAKEKAALPKTPIRLLKYQIQTEAANGKKRSVPRVSQLVLNVVYQCKHRGGITMAELKQVLAAEGYDVSKNNSRVNLVTKGLVKKETLVQTRGTGASASFKLSKKIKTDEKQVKTRALKSSKPKGPEKPASKSLRQARESNKPARKSPKQATNTRKLGSKSRTSPRQKAKPRGKSPKPRGKTRKAGRKSPKPAGKNPKTARKATRRVTRGRQAARKAQRAKRGGPKQTKHAKKYLQRRKRR
ncbi:histone H1-like [Myripristis murdjan]|uniref:histone H1-like n=1 Tax=Myripristis murdjan TaxID=586833 RepID=UPI001175D431|nr:histone H1-like [Myripristis murdjan]